MNKTQLDKTLGTIKNYVDATTARYLPLTGGTVTGATTFNNYLKLNAWSGYGSGTANFWYDGNNKTVEIETATNLKLAGTKVSKEGHTHSYLPLGGGTVTGAATMSGGLTIRRGTNTDETTYFHQEDTGLNIDLTNDEATGGIYFNFNILDDETNSGASAHTSTASIVSSKANGSTITANKFSGALIGNADTATQFSANKEVKLTGDVTGTASSKAGWSVATTLANSGVTAGSYGPSANASPAHSGTFSVPYITVDAKGRVTSASTKTITLPSDNNTDTKVTNTLGTTTKFYVTGTTSATTNTGTQTFDTGIYATTTAGQLQVTGGLISGSTVRSDTAVTDDLGATTIPWNNIFVKTIALRSSAASQTYGTFKAETTGTTSVTGLTNLKVGNNLASGTAENAKGQIQIFGTNTGYTQLTPGNNTTSNITLTLPSSTGTLARTADNVASATKLQTARTFTLGGVLSGSVSFDGSANVTLTAALANGPKSGDWWNNGPMFVNSDGAMEAGKYLDFHNTDTTTNDYSTRLQSNGDTKNTVKLPTASGTLALTTDNVASATKLQTARKIGQSTFDGTADISLRSIAGSVTIPGSSSGNTDKYVKFATIDCSGGTYRTCAGKMLMVAQEGNAPDGILSFYFRTGSAITSTSIELKWETLTDIAYADRVVAVKVSDGKHDLYLRPTGTYHTQHITVIDCTGQDYLTLVSGQSYVDSVTAAATSSLGTAFLPRSGGTMTGAITFNNNISIASKTPSAYTNTNTSAAVASGTAVNILTYNSSGNLHIGSGLYDNYLNTGNIYLNSPNAIAIRTRNSGNINFQINDSTVATFASDKTTISKTLTASAGIISGGTVRSDTAVTDTLGTSAYPWATAYAKRYSINPNNSGKSYGDLIVQTVGTTSTVGESRLIVGNNTASGTADNAMGNMFIYGTNTGYTKITPSNNTTSNITLTLPSSTGTLARTADNVASATKLATARTITLTGDVSGSASFDGSANVSITTAVANDSHTHSTYLPKAGGTMTGAIKNASLPSTYVTGATGAFIVSGESAGTYQPMMAAPTTNGSMVLSVYQDRMEVDYLTKANVDAGTNTVTKSVKLATEAGGGEWSGQIVAGGGIKTGGNIVSDTAITDSLGTAAIPFSNAYAKTIHAYGEANKSYGSLSAVTVGTTSTTGETRLTLGNSTASGTASNSRGRICMYGTNTGYTWIVPGYNDTSNITLTLPSSTGTLARTADNVASATKLATARTITLTGDVSGSASFDGSANISITATVANDSHSHSNYLPLAGGTMTGNITLNNNIKIRSKTPAAYTNSSTSAEVASGTSMTIFHYNSAGNLHIGDELYSNYLSTGNVYLSSPNDVILRTANGKSLYFKNADSTKMTVNSSGDLSLTGNIYLANNKAIGGKTADGSTTRWLTYVDTSNNSVFGNTAVQTKLVGNPITVASKFQMNGYAIYLETTDGNARIGVATNDDGTKDVYIGNTGSNWLRLKPDLTMTYAGKQIAIDGQTIGRLTTTNWWYSTGNTGWYNSTYNGGWYMTDTSWLRSYEDKGVYTGGKFKTTNEFLVEKAAGDTYLVASRTDSGVICKFGVGSGGSNHGVYSKTLEKWLVYGDATNSVVKYAMQNGGTASKDNLANLAFRYGSGLSGASGYITFSW